MSEPAYVILLRSNPEGVISRENADRLHATVGHLHPQRSLEIGMAHAASTLVILDASPGRLTSIDPSQTEVWGRKGVEAVETAGFSARHRLIEEPDYLALPDLLRAGEHFDFAYVDGWHSFDFVMLDLFYVDRLIPVGGVVGFNDCDWPAVDRALRFLVTHLRYDEVDRRRSKAIDRYFRKREEWTVPWDFYRRF